MYVRLDGGFHQFQTVRHQVRRMDIGLMGHLRVAMFTGHTMLKNRKSLYSFMIATTLLHRVGGTIRGHHALNGHSEFVALLNKQGLPPCGRRCRDRGCSQPQKAQARLTARLLFLRPSPPTQASLVGFFGHKKTPSVCLGLSGVGGPKRIRTAVAAFAELSLATRPSDPFQSGEPPWACEYTKVGSGRFHVWGINSGKTGTMQGSKG